MRKTILKSYDNSWYYPGKSKIVLLIWAGANIIFLKNPFALGSFYKKFLLIAFGAKIGTGVTIKPGVSIKYPWLLEVGDYCWIGENVWIDNLTRVKIGNNVCLSQGAMLLTGNHNYKSENFDLLVGEIILEDGVWIGAKSIVCPGITCMSHSILAVGSVANRNLAPYSIYQGNPCLKVRDREIKDGIGQ